MTARRPAEETARLGDEIYERDIRSLVRDAHDGEYVAIDVDSGCWTVAGNELEATMRLREQQPEAIDVWLLRVGHQEVARLGGKFLIPVTASEARTPGRLSPEETERLGEEIYERDVRPQVEAGHHGKVVAIDVESRCWAIGDDVLAARDRLRDQQPDAIDVWLLRVGHRALHHFGGRPLRSAE